MKTRDAKWGALVVAIGLFGLFQVPCMAADKPIKLGMHTILSGPFSDFGQLGVNGYKMAVEELNAKGGIMGRPVELIMEDSETNPQLAVRKVNKLVLQDNVDFIFTSSSSNVGLAVSKIMPQLQKIHLVNGANSEEITGKDCNKYTFRFGPSTPMEARTTAMFASQQPYKRYYLLGADYNWGHSEVKNFRAYMSKLKPEVEFVGEDFTPLGTKDFAAYINKIDAAKPDAVFLGIWGADFITFLKQAKQLGLKDKAKLFAPLIDVPVLKAAGDAAVGLASHSRYFFTLDTPQNREFVEKIAKRYQTVPDYEEEQAYTSVMILAKAIEKAGTVEDTNKLISTLETIEWNWLWGTLKMRKEDHQAIRDTIFGEVVAAPASQQDLPFPVSATVDFPYIRKPIIVPADKVAVPIEETGCKMEY